MKKATKSPTAPVTLTFPTVAETRDRIEAVAKREGMDVEGILSEAIYVHLHKLESRGNAKLRRQSVCWGCRSLMDAKAAKAPLELVPMMTKSDGRRRLVHPGRKWPR